MSIKLLWTLLLVTFGNFCEATAQVADIAGVLPDDRWVCELSLRPQLQCILSKTEH